MTDTEITLSWTNFKALCSSKELPMQYILLTNDYNIWFTEDGIKYNCYIVKVTPTPSESDQEDFEDNYMSSCNAFTTMKDFTTNRHAETGNTNTDSQTITDIDVADGYVEIADITEASNVLMVTDLSMSANKDGNWRIVVGGGPLKYIYFTANTMVHFERNLPFRIPANTKIALEFKTGTDGASASGCIGGYLI